jgi:hypothetical protein
MATPERVFFERRARELRFASAPFEVEEPGGVPVERRRESKRQKVSLEIMSKLPKTISFGHA